MEGLEKEAIHEMHELPVVTVTNYQKLGDLKQHAFILLLF